MFGRSSRTFLHPQLLENNPRQAQRGERSGSSTGGSARSWGEGRVPRASPSHPPAFPFPSLLLPSLPKVLTFSHFSFLPLTSPAPFCPELSCKVFFSPFKFLFSPLGLFFVWSVGLLFCFFFPSQSVFNLSPHFLIPFRIQSLFSDSHPISAVLAEEERDTRGICHPRGPCVPPVPWSALAALWPCWLLVPPALIIFGVCIRDLVFLVVSVLGVTTASDKRDRNMSPVWLGPGGGGLWPEHFTSPLPPRPCSFFCLGPSCTAPRSLGGGFSLPKKAPCPRRAVAVPRL